mmetsp:Transcript_37964/g.109560  ORF Transcript_37964/g.109560 Transcript_37964/m.109560 type:complete len:106 (-) Transcript_37964:820-1137(-)
MEFNREPNFNGKASGRPSGGADRAPLAQVLFSAAPPGQAASDEGGGVAAAGNGGGVDVEGRGRPARTASHSSRVGRLGTAPNLETAMAPAAAAKRRQSSSDLPST